jgi:hypothetical protein
LRTRGDELSIAAHAIRASSTRQRRGPCGGGDPTTYHSTAFTSSKGTSLDVVAATRAAHTAAQLCHLFLTEERENLFTDPRVGRR